MKQELAEHGAESSRASGVLPGVRGSNQSGMRAHNERLVLTHLRRIGPLPKAEIARLTGLSAQTVSVIMRALEADGLIARGEPQRGRVGQPSIPMHLAADGAYFFGLKVGRRSMELVLIDFLGRIRGQTHMTHRYPMPDAAVDFVRRALPTLAALLPEESRGRIAGLGIGLPFHLWDWADSLGTHAREMEVWRARDLRAELDAELDIPVFVENDASAACNAEIVFGRADRSNRPQDFLYAYIGYFAGGGLVLNGTLVAGRTGNAAAIGSMPVPQPGGGSAQLLQVASLCVLEAQLARSGFDPAQMWESPTDWALDDASVTRWVGGAAAALAHVAASAGALLDLEALVIDGWMPAALRDRLVAETASELRRIDLSGSGEPEVLAGLIGAEARALGAASIPLSRRFLVSPHILSE